MPAIPGNANDFVLNTDDPLDMVIYLDSGSLNNDGSGLPILVPHGLPFTPLVGGSWDVTPDFTTNYDYFSGIIPSPAPNFSPFAVEMDIAADATNIIFTPLNITGSDVTCYYRVFGFEPSDSHADLPPTASSGSDFILNTDSNYTKLYDADLILSPADNSSTVIPHIDLENPPQVMAWVTNFGYTEPVRGDLIASGDPLASLAVIVTDTEVTFKTAIGVGIERIDYRIYLDESGS